MSQQHMEIIDPKDAPRHLATLAGWHHEQWSGYNRNQSLQHILLDCESILPLNWPQRVQILKFSANSCLADVLVSTDEHAQAALIDLIQILEFIGMRF